MLPYACRAVYILRRILSSSTCLLSDRWRPAMTASPMTAGEHDEVFHSFVFCLPLVTINWGEIPQIFVTVKGVITNSQFLSQLKGLLQTHKFLSRSKGAQVSPTFSVQINGTVSPEKSQSRQATPPPREESPRPGTSSSRASRSPRCRQRGVSSSAFAASGDCRADGGGDCCTGTCD